MVTTDDRLDLHPARISRRAALQGWVTGVAPLLLLTACGGATATAPTIAPVGTMATPAASPTVAAAISTASPSPQAAASPAASPVITASPSGSPATSSMASPVTAASRAARVGFILTAERTGGASYIGVNLLRAAITEGKDGRQLQQNLMIQRLPSCQPVANALVEIWQCDALGEYSGFTAGQIQGQGEPPGSGSGTPPA